MTTTNKAAQTVACPKCNGRGSLDSFGHIDNGKCFLCYGSKVVSATSHTARDAARATAACTIHSLREAELEGLNLSSDWTTHMVARASSNMLVMADTASARAMLRQLSPELRALVVAKGFELKGA